MIHDGEHGCVKAAVGAIAVDVVIAVVVTVVVVGAVVVVVQ